MKKLKYLVLITPAITPANPDHTYWIMTIYHKSGKWFSSRCFNTYEEAKIARRKLISYWLKNKLNIKSFTTQ